MKKTKLVLATLAAAAFVTSAGALVACSKTTDGGTPVGNTTYTITFDANGGTLAGGTTKQTKTDGTLASLPDYALISYEGHEFVGWYTAQEAGTKVTTSYKFDAATTVYAHWTTEQLGENGENGPYTITFHANNGGDTTETRDTNAAGYLTDDAPNFTYAEHSFNGWYTMATGGESVSLAQKFTASTEVYAHWRDKDEELSHGPVIEYSDFYLTGAFNGDSTNNAKYRFQVAEPSEYEPDAKQYSLKATFDTDGVQCRIYNGGTYYAHLQDNLSSDVATDGGFGNSSKFTIVKAGTYEFFLKIYSAGNGTGSHNIWISTATPEVSAPNIDVVKANSLTMEDNTDNIETILYPTQLLEYKSTHMELYAGDTVSFTLDNKAQPVIVEKSSLQIDMSDTKNALQSITVLKDGYYDIYLKMWNDGRWTVNGAKVADIVITNAPSHTVTFDGNGGTVTATPAQTNSNGKLESLPAASTVTPPAGSKLKFIGWYTHETGGALVDEDKLYTNDTTIYAHYTIDLTLLTAAVNVNGAPTELTNNNANVPAVGQTAVKEYYKEGVALTAGAEITFTVDDNVNLTKFNTSACHGVSKTGAGKMTVDETGTFSIYVRYYEEDDKGNAACWVVEMTDGKVDTLQDGHYYLVGSMSDWTKPSAKHRLGANGGTVTVWLAKGTEFKIAQVKNGSTDWDHSFNMSAVKDDTSKKFVRGSDNLVIRADGTYTITLTGENITVSSTDAVFDYTTEPYSAKVTFAGGVVATLIFDFPEWGDNDTASIIINGTSYKLSANGPVIINASTVSASSAKIQIKFTQASSDPQNKDSKEATLSFVNGKFYMINIADWDGTTWIIGCEQVA